VALAAPLQQEQTDEDEENARADVEFLLLIHSCLSKKGCRGRSWLSRKELAVEELAARCDFRQR
jgi:hypothetical protein